jgi:predicted metal-dependent hydrolase
MQIQVNGIDVQVDKKNIKNMHLYVKPPLGRVIVSAPMLMTEKAVENFVRANIGWVKKQQEKFALQPRQTVRQYVSGETYYIWGKQYFLVFIGYAKRFFKIDGNTIILKMKESCTVEQRERYFREQYRKLLQQQLDQIVPEWEEKTNLYCDSYHIKYMTTKWGTCNSKAKRIWINLQMVEKPLECLDYVVLHELIHLKVRNHGKDFTALMDAYMPSWKDIQKELNGRMLDSL